MERHVEHPTVSHNHRCSRKQREPNNNNRLRDYEHHFAFMATTVGSNPDIPGDDDGTYRAPGKPMEIPATAVKYTSMKMEFEMYEEVKKISQDPNEGRQLLARAAPRNTTYHGKNELV